MNTHFSPDQLDIIFSLTEAQIRSLRHVDSDYRESGYEIRKDTSFVGGIIVSPIDGVEVHIANNGTRTLNPRNI